MKRLAVQVLAICVAQVSLAQTAPLQLSFQHLTQEDGLTNSINSHVFKDSRGLVWISSIDGLNRFDGSNVKSYRPDPQDSTALTGNIIGSSFYEDRQGNLWFTTYGALQCYHRSTDRFSKVALRDEDGVEQHADFYAFAFDSMTQDLWVRTGLGSRGLLHQVNVQSGESKVIGHLDGQRHVLLPDRSNGRVIISSRISRPGLSITRDRNGSYSSETHFDGSGSLPRIRINNLYAENLDRIYFGTEEGLGIFNANTATYRLLDRAHDGGVLGRVWSIARLGDRLLVTSELKGLLVFDPDQDQFLQALQAKESQRYSLRSNELREVYVDRSNCVWLSIWGQGLDYGCIGKRRFGTMDWSDLGFLTPLKSIGEDAQGNTQLVGQDGTLARFDQGALEISHLSIGRLGLSSLELLHVDDQGRQWVTGEIEGGSMRRILVLDRDRIVAEGSSPGELLQIHQRSPSSFLATSRQGVLSLDLEGNSVSTQVPAAFSEYSELPFYRFFDLAGRLYLTANFDRLLVFREEGPNLVLEADLEGMGDIKAMIPSPSDSVLYAAGSKGLTMLRIKDHVSRPIENTNELRYEGIYSLHADQSGTLWFRTENDLVTYSPQSGDIHRYSQADGVQPNRDHTMSSWQDQLGQIWIGGAHGLTVFDPSSIAAFTTPAEPILTDILVNDVPLSYDTTAIEVHTLELPYRENTVMMHFAPGEYSDPTAVRHRYRLHDHDDAWVYGYGAGSARYPNLPWGNYRFTLEVANSDGIWTEPGRSLSINIAPPWWGTWWARALYVLLILAAIHQFYLWRTRVQRRKIALQTQQLEQERSVNEKLRQVDLLKDQFLANTSHELRTPLSGIIGLAESLIDGATGELPQATNANLSMIAASGKRLAHLVDDILDFSKLKNADLDLHVIPVDLHTAAGLVIKLLSPLADAKGLTLRNEVDQSISYVNADENRLQQILVNLIGNGIKFTPEGQVRITAREDQDWVYVEVHDSGMGIRKEKLGTIFRSFEQGDGSAEREFGGTGLGLAITKKLVELHGGSIKVESQPGQGSTFTFTLKRSDVQQSAPASALQPEEQLTKSEAIDHTSAEMQSSLVNLGDRLRILAVDDEQVNIQVLKNHLSLVGFDVVAANSGPQALEIIHEQGPFDLVLLDIMMPRMSGYEVCEILRKQFMPSELPIIMLTAKNQTVDLVQGFDVGANDYLSKPFSKDELLSRIKTHIRLHNIYQATGRFVPHHFLKTIGREEITEVRLGDHSVCREISVLFADIRNYTPLSESMTPEENFKFVNAFAGRMGPIIEKYDGFVNQHLGDAVMAIFPGPTAQVVHAAREMHLAMKKYSEERAAVGRIPIHIGIGVHTGTLIMGIIGYLNRTETATVSDTVNIASRIEGLTKHFGANTIISETTRGLMDRPEDHHMRCLGTVLVKGKRDPIMVYECLDGDPAELRACKIASMEQFAKGLSLFEQGQFESAVPIFKEIVSICPEDLPAQKFLTKSNMYLHEGVPLDWDGTQVLSTKV
ncbi:MAG: response regulator [Saprospiraceae bacterium]|nr:response regulator [Saprospiraceae bacterium]